MAATTDRVMPSPVTLAAPDLCDDQADAAARFAMNEPLQPIPVRADPSALTRAALRSVARACLHVARNAGKSAVVKHPWQDDRAIDGLVTRAPVAPTRIADAQALAQVKLFFLPSLVPQSAAAAVLSQAMGFSFDGRASISVPSLSLPLAGFVGEAMSIPVLQGSATANTPLTPAKLAAIVVLTREMVESADAENVMRQVLAENIGASLDAAFFSTTAAVPTVSPAGILYNIVPITAAATGSDAIVKDLAALAQALGPVAGNSSPVLVCAPAQASAIKSVIIDPPPMFTSNTLPVGTVVAIVPAAIACANDAPIISASLETTVHMASPATDLVSSPGTVAAPQRSIFQTDSLALRFSMDTTWTTRGAGVAMITGVNWP